jgi:hypothetical protein
MSARWGTHWPNRSLHATRDTRGLEQFGPKQASMLLYGAATLSLVAALIHVWVMPEHFDEWWGYGTFFLIVALAQWFYAFALLRWPARRTFFLGIVAHLAIIGLYIVTRTAGIPLFGPHAGEVEDVGVVDFTSKLAELALVIFLVALMAIGGSTLSRWRRQWHRRTRDQMDRDGAAKVRAMRR